jgi:hypothetical protein
VLSYSITKDLHEFLKATVPGDSLEYELIVHGNITETEVGKHSYYIIHLLVYCSEYGATAVHVQSRLLHKMVICLI